MVEEYKEPAKDLHDEIVSRLDMLRCPDCRGPLGYDSTLKCKACDREFFDQRFRIYDLTPSELSQTKEEIVEFWGDIYQQWYEAEDSVRTFETLSRDLAL